MVDQSTDIQTTTNPEEEFYFQMVTVFVLTMGVTILAFAFTYAQDLETLRTVPGAIWSAICGRPYDDGITLPLLFTLGTLSTITGLGLLAWKAIKNRIA